MAYDDLKQRWHDDGFVIAPAYLPAEQLRPAREELPRLFPAEEDFHDGVDNERNARFRDDQFAGITRFPFESLELSLLSVHERLIDLAEALLDSKLLQVYAIDAWAKYTGAADYDQPLHRDYPDHSLLTPACGQPAQQVEMFLYLNDVPTECGPPSFVPLSLTKDLPAVPNWYPRADSRGDERENRWDSMTGRSDLYDAEVRAAGPAGTVVAYRIETFHRGTAMVKERGVRYTVRTSFRRPEAYWIARRGWPETANDDGWCAFVRRASPRQLALFGFPPPGHPYWTEETLAGVACRYQGIDLSPWRWARARSSSALSS